MQTENLIIGLSLSIVSGIMLGSFALPQKRIKVWQWENYWGTFTLFSAFLLPFIIAIITIPSFFLVITSTPGDVLLSVFLFGVAWGIANIGYGISIKKLGMALAFAIVLGMNNIVGTIAPLILNHPEKLSEPVGIWIMVGVAIMLLGIVFSSIAAKVRAKELHVSEKTPIGISKKSSLSNGILIAIVAGILAASFNFALIAGKPIELIAIEYGTQVNNASNMTWFIGLSGGFIVTFMYCAFLWKKNNTFSLFFSKQSGKGWYITLIMGVLWFGGVLLYGVSVNKLGTLGSSIGWPVIQSVSIGSANLLGILSGEFKGAKKSLKMVYISLLCLIIGICCIGYAGSL